MATVFDSPRSFRLDGLDPVVLLNGMLDDATQKGSEVHEELVNTMALSLARKAAIPVGKEMSNEEMRDLIDRLFRPRNTHLYA